MSQTPEQALEPYCLLAKQCKGRPTTGAKIVRDAVGHPGTFLFGELLDMEGIKGVRLFGICSNAFLARDIRF
jgi:hypothetical protein